MAKINWLGSMSSCLYYCPQYTFLCLIIMFAMLNSSVLAQSYEKQSLPDMILYSLKVDKAKKERGGDYEDIISRLKSSRYIHRRYDSREDYLETYSLHRPLKLLNNTVVSVYSESIGKFIGCCPKPHIGFVMVLDVNDRDLREFAKENVCEVGEVYDERLSARVIKELGINPLKANRMISMQCDYTEYYHASK